MTLELVQGIAILSQLMLSRRETKTWRKRKIEEFGSQSCISRETGFWGRIATTSKP